jgi:YegS/Rv2252/BmrU family lipid kinase
MRIAVVLNGISRKKAAFYRTVYPQLARAGTVDVWETQTSGHAIELARAAADLDYPVVLAAGGDGTLHQVLNGLRLSQRPQLPILGVVPLGTGNDFARLMQLHLHRTDWLRRQLAPPQAIDLGCIRFGRALGETRYFINACSTGLGPEVVQRLASGSRALGAFVTYFIAIAQTFLANRPQPLTVTTDTFTWTGKMRVAAVANGKSFGNQIYIAPEARVADGRFNTFIAGEVTLLDFLKYLGQLKSQKTIRDPRIQYGMATRVVLESPTRLWIEAEGELVCQLPAEITLLPAAQRFLGAI